MEITNVDDEGIKEVVNTLDKLYTRNQDLRIKYRNNAQMFMESETDLHTHVII